MDKSTMLVLLWHYEPILPTRNLAKTIFFWRNASYLKQM